MLCERCQERPATVHLAEIANQQKVERHLCEQCSTELDLSLVPKPAAPTHLVKDKPAPLVPRPDPLAAISCPVCGMTFERFRTFGRLGCANDYVAFRVGLEPLLEKIHGAVEHTGRVPLRVSARLERRRRLQELREQLNRAIAQEEYERAAVLRDRIHELEEADDERAV